MSRSAPSVMGRCSAMSCITLTSNPFNNATRSVKLSLKSISPRMARSVIFFTFSPTPARSASSSMHSVWMSVESISKQIKRRMRRNMSSRWKEKSMSIFEEMRIKSACICARSAGVPRSDNSRHARTFLSTALMLLRPVRRMIESMFRPCSATTSVAAAI